MSTPDKSDQASLLLENARAAAESSLGSPEEALEIAMGYTRDSFVLNPHNTDCLGFLFELARKKDLSLLDLGVYEQLLVAIEVELSRNLILEQVLKCLFDKGDGTKEKIGKYISLLEKLIETDPDIDPQAMKALSTIYKVLGRLGEALDLLSMAAEKDLAYAGNYMDLCYEMERYDEMLDFWETYNPPVSEKMASRIANVYQKRALNTDRSISWEERLDRQENGTQPEDYENIRKARQIFHNLHQMHLFEDKITPDTLMRSLNYAQILYHEATLIRDFKDPDDTQNLPDYEGLVRKSMAISGQIMEELTKALRAGPDEADPEALWEWYRILLQAKFNFVAASIHIDSAGDELDEQIAVARDLCEDEHFGKLGNHTVALNYITLADRLIMKYDETRDSALLSEVEEIFHEAIKINWREKRIYLDGIKFFAAIGKVEEAAMMEQYLYTSSLLERLIKVDKLDMRGEAILVAAMEGKRSRTSGSKKYMSALLQSVEERKPKKLPLKSYFQPLYDALTPHADKYRAFLRDNIPETADIGHRLKSPTSILLKFLKLEAREPEFVGDIAGFKVLTDSEEESWEVFERVKADLIEDDNLDIEITLDNPTSAGYRSLDASGNSKSCGLLVDTQIRPKSVEAEMETSVARHDHFKIRSGETLESEVDADPHHYLRFLNEMFMGLAQAYRELNDIDSLDLKEVVECYKKYGVQFAV
jgi:hypothetical protein